MDKFKHRYVLIPNIFSTQGPKGDQGPPGADGASALPISSDDVLYQGQQLTQVLDDLTYIPLSISFFTTPVSIYEKGQVLSTIQLSWGYNKSIQSQTITGSGVTPPTLSLLDRVRVVSCSISSNSTITLTADDNTGDTNPAKTSTVNLQFLNKVYWGKHALGTIDSAFILALTGQQLQPNRLKSFSTTTGVGEYIFFASPVAYGIPDFKANGFDGGFDLVSTLSFTNASGYTENYYVYRTTFDNLGLTNVDVL